METGLTAQDRDIYNFDKNLIKHTNIFLLLFKNSSELNKIDININILQIPVRFHYPIISGYHPFRMYVYRNRIGYK